MFKKGEKVFITEGKHAGESMHILNFHISHKPLLYTGTLTQGGLTVALFDDELESTYAHDRRMLQSWRDMH